MTVQLDSMREEDGKQVIGIFNHYIENGYAAYLENKVEDGFFLNFLAASKDLPAYVARDGDAVAGFCMLRRYHPFPAFRRTAEVSYFIAPGMTGKGIGNLMLERMTDDARQRGIDSLLASISSLNEGSIRFHQRNGFVECGRFLSVGRKRGRDFDLVWMQKRL